VTLRLETAWTREAGDRMLTTRDKLLLFLKENKEKWVSGEWLSQRLAVSRAAISKHVRHLRRMGYPIETSTNKGYCLGEPWDLLLPDEIREGLETRIFGARDMVFLPETDSTNLRAKDLAAGGAPEGTIVFTEKQTAGRGRKGRSWHSPEGGGIYLSLILRPAMTPSEAPKITLMTGVAAAEALLALTRMDVRIKWPNDLLVGGKKIAGILTEISTDMDRIDYVVVGIGINVNIPRESLAPEIRESATSVLIAGGQPLPRVKVIRTLLKSFEDYYGLMQGSGFEPIRTRWKELSNLIGRRITVAMIGKTLAGEVVDIDMDGVLIVKDHQGEHHRIVSGDVTLV
jgi:BirA family transcriptional regulator, biotin operon repressor / biotin---[acetyl-CoA-carboxylase] ligase